MSINQLNFQGMTKLDVAIKRLQTFEPKDKGYYLAFSGGKDSVVVKVLCDMAKVKYDAHYNVTTVDPPELMRFIKEHHPDVKWDRPRDKEGKLISMWTLIPKKKMPPTRIARYCCAELKERGGDGRFVVTGVRWDESAKRRYSRGGLEVDTGLKQRERVDPDNPDNEEMVRVCSQKGKHILNPIIDWTDGEVWEFIKTYNVPYCKLYDEGRKRLGCIGCPMNTQQQQQELERYYPNYKRLYLRAFKKMLDNLNDKSIITTWHSPEDVYEWWCKQR